jgi:hypothetical protein
MRLSENKNELASSAHIKNLSLRGTADFLTKNFRRSFSSFFEKHLRLAWMRLGHTFTFSDTYIHVLACISPAGTGENA